MRRHAGRHVLVVLLHFASLTASSKIIISEHFRALKANKAHERDTTLLPEVAAVPILRLHDSHSVGTIYLKMMVHELLVRKETPSDNFPYVLCGPQGSAESARALLKKATGDSRSTIAYASRAQDVACWHADLTVAAAAALSGAPSFYHITPLPAVSKLAPTLVLHTEGAPLRVNPLVFDPEEPRLRVVFRPSVAKDKKLRAAALQAWGRASFGLEGDHAGAFFPYRGSEEGGSPAWGSARDRAALADCPRRLELRGNGDDGAEDASGVRFAFSSLNGQTFKHLRRGPRKGAMAEDPAAVEPADAGQLAEPSEDDHACALLALAFLAAQPEVQVVEVHAPATTLAHTPPPPCPPTPLPTGSSAASQDARLGNKGNIPSPTLPAAEAADRLLGTMRDSEKEKLLGHLRDLAFRKPAAVPAMYSSAAALQSGNDGDLPFWNIGMDGADELVHVTDTGADDASCFLRNFGPTSSLVGPLSPAMQVKRSVWNKTVTDFKFRKVVQYVGSDKGHPSDFFQDYKSGHGSHVAATVVGSKLNSAEFITYGEDATNCTWVPKVMIYYDVCSSFFCSTCEFANLCDATCGFNPPDTDYPGMAPGAQITVHDFGNAEGELKAPDNYATRLFIPGYNAGARIFTNSWGSAPFAPYSSSEQGLDEWIYDTKTVLVLFAAGNYGGTVSTYSYSYSYSYSYDFEMFMELLTQDKSICIQAQSKNVLAVGAAETVATPTTVASFSSRGPANDGRIKPDVVGPGDPIVAESASGLAGLATCSIVGMSGTSMATPGVAGVAALLRQYLRQYHAVYSPKGFSASSYSAKSPSGALLKAMLVGGTVPLTSGYDSSGNAVTLATFYGAATAVADTAPYPLGTVGLDFHQGFGHVRTSALFPLDGSFDTVLIEQSLAANSEWSTSFTFVPFTTVGVTLVWSDPPSPLYCGCSWSDCSSPEFSSTPCLVHDLDLVVTYKGKRYFANFGAATAGAYAQANDEVNNVEKVLIPTGDLTAGGVVTVAVKTNGLAFAPTQDFAVVITGKLGTASAEPVAIDTIVVMTTNAAIGAGRRRLSTGSQEQLKRTTAAQLGLTASQLRPYVFTQTSATPTTWTWQQTFTVVATPAQLSSASASEAAAKIKTLLGPTSSYGAKVQASMQLSAPPVVTSVSATQDPAAVINLAPTPAPVAAPAGLSLFGLSLRLAIGVMIGGILIICVVAGVIVFIASRKGRQMPPVPIQERSNEATLEARVLAEVKLEMSQVNPASTIQERSNESTLEARVLA